MICKPLGRTMENNKDLRDFLRARRARLTPADVGLEPHSARRRVCGLRREEVARLANISADYYSRLEQGRRINVSMEILNAVAKALLLTLEEHKYLVHLVFSPTAHVSVGRQADYASALRIVERLAGIPAAILGGNLDVVAMNEKFKDCVRGYTEISDPEINVARAHFSMAEGYVSRPEWEFWARRFVALLRRNVHNFGRDAEMDLLIENLQKESPDFRKMWDEYPIWANDGDSVGIINEIGDWLLEFEIFFISDVSPLTVVAMKASS